MFLHLADSLRLDPSDSNSECPALQSGESLKQGQKLLTRHSGIHIRRHKLHAYAEAPLGSLNSGQTGGAAVIKGVKRERETGGIDQHGDVVSYAARAEVLHSDRGTAGKLSVWLGGDNDFVRLRVRSAVLGVGPS